ncbi:HpsJ family protein [Myxosarcina sp. GI1]|uniref:HpsJ-like protein, cyanoexosortase A-associated n=1 Tax=Myxosarcina sp. GI1 TaxID=1541065 RepID=UPI00055E052A|nr:HpsJ family protein [Myxosarcina sp. GI1]
MNISQERQIFSSGILRLVGYGLLILALIDLFFLLIPPQLMNPVWEFQTIGAIIERIPVSLLGIVLVYYGERSDRAPIEFLILRWLSRLCLIASIVLLLMIPLSITNSFRIYYQHSAEVNSRVVGQIDAMESFQERIKSANSANEIGAILQQQASQKVNITDSINPARLKTEIVEKLQNKQIELRNKSQALRSQKRSVLLKSCFKWNLGALISSMLFFFIWKSTLWARLETNMEDS